MAKPVRSTEKALERVERAVRKIEQNTAFRRYRGNTHNLGEGGSRLVFGFLDSELEYDGSATLSVWVGEAGSEEDSGDNYTVRGWPMGNQSSSIASGTRVVAAQINGYWYVISAACEADS